MKLKVTRKQKLFEKSMRINQGELNSHIQPQEWIRKLIRRKILGEIGLRSYVNESEEK
jgi:hypothetical protein